MRNICVSVIRTTLKYCRTAFESSLAEALYLELGPWRAEAFLMGAKARLDQTSIRMRSRLR